MELIQLHALILKNITLAGELKDFNIEDHISKDARRMDRFTQYAVSGKTSCRRC